MSVESVISRELIQRGFLRKGKRSFYLRKNDIIALFTFERPTGVLYLQFAVIPLFLPCPGHITFSFGRRLDSLFHDLPTITKEATKEQMQEYCALALEHIDHDVLPVIHVFNRRFAQCVCKKETQILCRKQHKNALLYPTKCSRIACVQQPHSERLLRGRKSRQEIRFLHSSFQVLYAGIKRANTQ